MLRTFYIICISMIFLLPTSFAAEPSSESTLKPINAAGFRAGAAVVDISPTIFPVKIAGGFLEAQATKVNDLLYARCLVLDDGKTQIALVVVDTCMMPRKLIDEAKNLANKECGISPDHILVSATHTHSAPAAMGCLGTRVDADYAAMLPGKIAEGIAAATKKLEPAKIGWCAVDDWEHTHNRRWVRQPEKMVVDPFGKATGRANMHPGYLSADIIGPSGPVDPGLSVISVQSQEGKPLAVFANYSQHYFGAGAVSADYYGLFCKHVAKLLGQSGEGNGPFVCAISQGTSGDLMWMDYGAPRKNISLDGYAAGVAKYAEQAIKQVRYQDHAELAMVEKTLPLKYRVPDKERLDWAKPIAARIANGLPKDRTEVYAQEALILHELQQTEIKLQAIRIGDLTIAALPNEVYALTGLKLKAQSPFAAHFNIELSNGGDGYIPPPEQHALGGYTTWPARTAGLEVQAEPRIVETLLNALEEATGAKRRVMRSEHGPYANAILQAKPVHYWRLDEAEGKLAMNAVAGGSPANVSDGAAWYLPGVGSGTGVGAGEQLHPSAFSGPTQINRAIHLAGGDIQADAAKLGPKYSIALWYWLGEASGASEREGTLIAAPGGESLIGKQSKDHRVNLMLNGSQTKQSLPADEWQFAVLVRDGEDIRLHVNGNEQPDLTTKRPVEATKELRFGKDLQGKLDEIAVFDRALSGNEIKQLWKASGIEEERAKVVREREQAEKLAMERARPPKFPENYTAAITALKPLLYASLDAPPQGWKSEGNVKHAASTFASFTSGRLNITADKLGETFSVSLWFKNDKPNDISPVTAYLFSRGPNGDKAASGDHLGIGGNYRTDLVGRIFVFNGNTKDQIAVGRSIIPSGTWNHAVFIRSGKRITVYLNGEPKPEIEGEMEITATGSNEIFLGARSDHFAPLQGYLAHIAMFNRALSSEEAKQLHVTSGQPVGTPQATVSNEKSSAVVKQSEAISPEESLRRIHVPAGFQVELVAAEPLLVDPVAFDWDDRGRLWVVEMSDYPLGLDNQGKPGGRVRVLEDSNGDGRYDKSTVFAEGLNFPNGILTWRDGAIITCAPEIVFLRDANNDGKVDERRTLITGLLEGNQQLRANGLRWGLDHWVYVAAGGHHGNHGVNTRLTSTLTGKTTLVGSRDFRFRPDTGELEPQSGPTQFGRNRDDWGHWFGTQNSNPLWHYVLPDHYLARNPHFGAKATVAQLLTPTNPPVFPASPLEKRFHSFNQAGHFTSACGGMIYRDAKLFPANEIHAFVCEPFHNLVQHVRLADHGVTYSAERVANEDNYDFFASEDRWCRPVMVREAPDGSLWIADMYRYMIEHPEWLPPQGKAELLPHYREGDDRGRIYRVFKKGMPSFQSIRFDKLTTAELVVALDTTNGWQRDKVHQQLLWKKDAQAAPLLREMALRCENPRARLHALCVLDGLGVLQPAELAKALTDRYPGVRENALRLAETLFTPELLAAAIRLVDDEDAKVRLQLAFSLGASSDSAAGEALGRLLIAQASDPMMVAAVMSSASPHLTQLVAAMNRAQDVPSELKTALLNMAVAANDRASLSQLLSPILASGEKHFTSAQFTAYCRIVDQLAQSKTSLDQLQAKNPSDSLGKLIADSATLVSQAQSVTANDALPPAERIAAAGVLCRIPSARAEAIKLLTRWLDPQQSAEIQAAAIRELSATGSSDIPALFAEAWSTFSPTPRTTAFEAWVSREVWAFDLTQRLERGQIPLASIDTVQRARLLKHSSARIRQLAEKVFSASNAARDQVVREYQPALSLVGVSAKGREVYLRACANCHKHGDAGKEIGPSLSSVVNHPPEKLLRSILDPSADIQPGFASYTCTLNDGIQFVGIISAETANSVTLKLADGSQKTVLRNQIESLQSQQLSLMPDRFEGVISQQDMADLISFLRAPLSNP